MAAATGTQLLFRFVVAAYGTQLLFRFVVAAYERRALGVASHWAFNDWDGSCPSTPPPRRCWTGCCTTP